MNMTQLESALTKRAEARFNEDLYAAIAAIRGNPILNGLKFQIGERLYPLISTSNGSFFVDFERKNCVGVALTTNTTYPELRAEIIKQYKEEEVHSLLLAVDELKNPDLFNYSE